MGHRWFQEPTQQVSETHRFLTERQQLYQSEGHPGYENRSGSMENRLFPTGLLFHTIIQHLPSYITPDESVILAKDHPNPILYIHLHQEEDNDNVGIDFNELGCPPQFAEIRDKACWYHGIIALQEIATERLRRDILENILQSHPGMQKHIAPFAKLFSEGYDQNPEIKYIKDILQSVFEEDAITFERELVRAVLFNDHTDLNESLSVFENTSNIHDFAYKLFDIILREKEKVSNSETEKTKTTHTELGSTSYYYPGIIDTQIVSDMYKDDIVKKVIAAIQRIPPGYMHNISFYSALIGSGIFIPDSLHLYIQVVIHEMCHYLSTTQDRFGFLRMSKVE